jgi:uncharacterized repeat protein (TIGR03803 family)
MKKIFLYLFCGYVSLPLCWAQTPYLWGCTSFGSDGKIIKINGDGTGLSNPFSFNGSVTGSNPLGDLLYANNGIIYGCAYTDGTQPGFGVLFSFNPIDNVYNILVDFRTIPFGSWPDGSLCQTQNNKIYGTTVAGGLYGSGTIYSYDISNSAYSRLFNFAFGSINGCPPNPALKLASDGKLYGTAGSGGLNDWGTIFSFDPLLNNFTKIHDFDSINGRDPTGGLLQATDGKLYGTTSFGGINNYGIIYSVDLAGNNYTVEHYFDSINGKSPLGNLIQASDGKIYGLAQYGGADSLGVIYSFNIVSHSFTKLFDFDALSGALHIYNHLMQASNGKLYGMAGAGGTSTAGTIFMFDIPSNTFNKLIDFDGQYGALPYGGLIELPRPDAVSENVLPIFQIDPNPTSSIVTLKYSLTSSYYYLIVLDIFGQQLITKTFYPCNIKKELDISELASGIYFVTLRGEKGSVTRKLIKE